jgi:hypothetical protein
MSDERTTTTDMPDMTRQASVNETMLAIRSVGQDVAKIRARIRTMWIVVAVVAVVAVLTVASAGSSFVPRMLSGGGPPGTTAGAAGGASAGTSNGTAPGGASAPSITGQ